MISSLTGMKRRQIPSESCLSLGTVGDPNYIQVSYFNFLEHFVISASFVASFLFPYLSLFVRLCLNLGYGSFPAPMKPKSRLPENSMQRYQPAETNAVLDFPNRPCSVESLAAHLDCTPRFIRNEILAGRLKACRLSARMIRVMPTDVQKWLDSASTASE
jgi:hypothetical protein